MSQFQGQLLEWDTNVDGSTQVRINNDKGEFSHTRAASEEELKFINTINVLRKISSPPYVLTLKSNYIVPPLSYKQSLSESVR